MQQRHKSLAAEKRPPVVLSAADLALARSITAELRASLAPPANPARPAAPVPAQGAASVLAVANAGSPVEHKRGKRKSKKDRRADREKLAEAARSPAPTPAPQVVLPVKDEAAVAARKARKELKRAKKAAGRAKKAANKSSPSPPPPSPPAPTPASPSAAKLKRRRAKAAALVAAASPVPSPVKATGPPSKKRRRDASEDANSTAIPTPAESTSTLPPPAKKRKRTKSVVKPQTAPPTPSTSTLVAAPSSKAASVAARTQQVLALLRDTPTEVISSERKHKSKQVAPPSESDSDSVVVARAPTPAPVIASLAALPRRQVVVSAVDPLHALRRALFPPGWYEEPAAEPVVVDVEEVAVQTSPAPEVGPSTAELEAVRLVKANWAAEKKARKKARKAAAKASLAASQGTVATVVGAAPAPAPPALAAQELVKNSREPTARPTLADVATKGVRECTQDAIVEAEGSVASGSQRSTGSARKTKRVRGKKAMVLLPTSRSASPGAVALSPAVSAEPATRDLSPAAALVSPMEAEIMESGPTVLVTVPLATDEDVQVVEDSADDAEVDELEGSTQREQASPSTVPDAEAPAGDPMEVDELEGSTQRAQVEPSPELHGGVEVAPAVAPGVAAVPAPTPEASEPTVTVASEINGGRWPSPAPENDAPLPAVAPSPEPERRELSSPPPAQRYATIGAPANDSDSSSSDDSSDSDDSDEEPTPAKKKARMSIGALAAEAFGRSPAKGRKLTAPSLPASQLSQVLATADDVEDLEWLQSQSARTPNSALAKLLASNDDEAEDADEEGSRSSRFSSIAPSDEEGRKPTFERQPAAAPLADDDSDTETPGATTPVAQEVDREKSAVVALPEAVATVPERARIDDFARESPPPTQDPSDASALQATSPRLEANTLDLPASPTHSDTGSTLAVPPGRRLMSISGHTSDAEQLEDTSFSSQPIESSQFDDPLYPESQYVPLVKDQPLFLESQETQETQPAAGPSSVGEQRVPSPVAEAAELLSVEEPATPQVDVPALEVEAVEGDADEEAVEPEAEPVAQDSQGLQDDAAPAPADPVLRHSSRLATRSPSPSRQGSTAPTSSEETDAPRNSNGKAPAAAPQRRSTRAASVQAPATQTPLRAVSRARGASQDTALRKAAAAATPSSSVRPVRASRMLSLSQIDERALRKSNGTPKSSQPASSQPAGSSKKAWIANGAGDDDSDDESTPRKNGKNGRALWG